MASDDLSKGGSDFPKEKVQTFVERLEFKINGRHKGENGVFVFPKRKFRLILDALREKIPEFADITAKAWSECVPGIIETVESNETINNFQYQQLEELLMLVWKRCAQDERNKKPLFEVLESELGTPISRRSRQNTPPCEYFRTHFINLEANLYKSRRNRTRIPT